MTPIQSKREIRQGTILFITLLIKKHRRQYFMNLFIIIVSQYRVSQCSLDQAMTVYFVGVIQYVVIFRDTVGSAADVDVSFFFVRNKSILIWLNTTIYHQVPGLRQAAYVVLVFCISSNVDVGFSQKKFLGTLSFCVAEKNNVIKPMTMLI